MALSPSDPLDSAGLLVNILFRSRFRPAGAVIFFFKIDEVTDSRAASIPLSGDIGISNAADYLDMVWCNPKITPITQASALICKLAWLSFYTAVELSSSSILPITIMPVKRARKPLSEASANNAPKQKRQKTSLRQIKEPTSLISMMLLPLPLLLKPQRRGRDYRL